MHADIMWLPSPQPPQSGSPEVQGDSPDARHAETTEGTENGSKSLVPAKLSLA